MLDHSAIVDVVRHAVAAADFNGFANYLLQDRNFLSIPIKCDVHL